ncbi:ribosome biogenesis protein SLX9-domain-containing protein [Limtongia smithiae]|uniref:ribosome biogenesis protein SLX9-domain-containing protein n=1 Tax=Limtongia smithiae TaxID=1125753 RepID=UPI0034CF4976
MEKCPSHPARYCAHLNCSPKHKMVPKRKSIDRILEARRALRAHQDALKLAAVERTLVRASASASTSGLLSTGGAARTGGRIEKTTKKSKVAAKKAKLLGKLNADGSANKVVASTRGRTKVRMPTSLANTRTATSAAAALLNNATNVPPRSSTYIAKPLSKSALRRQNRANRDKLAGGSLGDLMDALPSSGTHTPAELSTADDSAMELDGTNSSSSQHNPDGLLSATRRKPVSSKTNEKIVKQEIDRFGRVMLEKKFRENPFAALRGFIQQRI